MDEQKKSFNTELITKDGFTHYFYQNLINSNKTMKNRPILEISVSHRTIIESKTKNNYESFFVVRPCEDHTAPTTPQFTFRNSTTLIFNYNSKYHWVVNKVGRLATITITTIVDTSQGSIPSGLLATQG